MKKGQNRVVLCLGNESTNFIGRQSYAKQVMLEEVQSIDQIEHL